MGTINWRERFIAAAIHLAATLLITGVAALLIFLVWFPSGLAWVTGGMQLFLLMVGCDAVLGPLVSLFIYNPAKGRGKLLLDYCLVGGVQLLALGYGIYVVSQSRPVFIAYDAGHLAIVSAIELEPEDLIQASDREYRTKPLTGPKLIAVQRPTDPKELADLVFAMIAGMNPATKPTYYRSYDTARDSIQKASASLELLLTGSGENEAFIRRAIEATDKDAAQLRWLAARHRFGMAVALIDADTLQPVGFIPVDPTWVKRELPKVKKG